MVVFLHITNNLLIKTSIMKTKQNKTNPRRILGYLMALVMVLFTNGNAWAQTTVTVGTGTTVAAGINGVPVYRSTATSSFHHAKSMQLLTASQLAGAGIGPGSNISSWAYYRTVAGMPAGSNAWTLNVYLKNVSNTALASGTSWDGLISGATLAYSTTINAASPAAVGWWTWPTSGFTYTGGSVMACIEWVPVGTIVSPAFTAGMSWLYTASTGYQAMGTSSIAPILGTYATWSLSATSNARFYNTQITYTAGANCSGIPNSGTAVISNAAGCAGASQTLSVTGGTTDAGMSFQWQSSPDSITWTDISGATTSYYTVATGAGTTYYQLVSTCSFSGDSSVSSVVSYTGVSGCVSACAYPAIYATSALNAEIASVTVGSMTNTSDCSTLATEDLCTKLYESNTLMVGFGHFKNKRFIRLVVVNCENSLDDLMQFFTVLEEFTQQNKHLIKKI